MGREWSWRDIAKKVINEERDKYPHATEEEFRQILKQAYPFGERQYHPYKIWLDQVKKSMHLFFHTPIKTKQEADPQQLNLF